MIRKIVGFLSDCKGELKKVAWPSKEELKSSVTVVIISFVIFAVLIALVDFILTKTIGKLI